MPPSWETLSRPQVRTRLPAASAAGRAESAVGRSATLGWDGASYLQPGARQAGSAPGTTALAKLIVRDLEAQSLYQRGPAPVAIGVIALMRGDVGDVHIAQTFGQGGLTGGVDNSLNPGQGNIFIVKWADGHQQSLQTLFA